MNNQKNDSLQNVSILEAALSNLASIDITKAKKVIETDFAYRLVICYEESDKFINYKEIAEEIQKIELEKREMTRLLNIAISKKDNDAIKANNDKIKELEEKQKTATKKLIIKEEYKLTMILSNMINQLNFDYAIKANKYVYLIHKTDVDDATFQTLQKLDNNGHLKNTINLKNIKSVYANFYIFLLEKIIKQNKATDSQKKEYEELQKKFNEKK